MTGSALLKAEDLTCGFRRGEAVLSGISLEVPHRTTAVLVGRSGCGKTTLLRTLLGLLPPLGGRATVLGATLPSRPPSGHLGYVPQGLGLVRHASVLHNVLSGTLPDTGWLRSLLGSFPRRHVLRALDALERVGLTDKAGDLVLHLSGGQRRRVAIARALVQRPRLLVADEALSDLDEATADTVLGAIRAMQDETGMGILMVEHDLERSCAVGDTLLCAGNGSLLVSLPRSCDRIERAREVMARRAPRSAP